MGFEPQIRSILKHVPTQRQTMLFSATWPREIQALAREFLHSRPVQINVGEVNALVANKDIQQTICMLQEDEKLEKLEGILENLLKEANEDPESATRTATTTTTTNGNHRHTTQHHQQQHMMIAGGGKLHAKVIVFVAKKVSCNDLANRLWDDGFAVDSLHGDRPQWERTKVMQAFKSGQLRMLIATGRFGDLLK